MKTIKTSAVAVLIAAIAVLGAVSDSRADLDQGMDYFKSGKYMEAAAAFQELVDQSPTYDFGYYMMGLSFLQMKKPADAEKNLLKAIELNGDKFEYHHSLAKAYYDQRQFPKAIAALKTAEPLAGDDRTKFALYYLRGISYSALDKWADSIDDLEKARAIKSNAAILDRLGSAYYKLGHNDKALPVLRESVKLAPTNGAMLARLTNVLLNMGAESKNESQKIAYYKEALGSADKYKGLNSNSTDAHNLVGRAALGSKNYVQAEQSFRKVLALQSDHCYAMANLGKTYIAQDRWSEAESILVDAAACAPRLAVVYENLGFAQQKQKKLPEAIASYKKGLALKPSAASDKAIATCEENIRIAQHNQDMDSLDAEQQAAEAAEAARIAEEERKQKEWEKERRKDE